jgi:hypothetical protein
VHAVLKNIRLQGNAPVVVEFKVEAGGGLEIDSGIEAIIADKVRSARRNAGVQVTFAVVRGTARGAMRGATTAENVTDHGLVAPRG